MAEPVPGRKPIRKFTEIGRGTEGGAYGYTQDDVEQPWVIKPFDRHASSDGLLDYQVADLRDHYAALVKTYGDLIVKQRIMPRSEMRDDDGNPTRWFMMQERLQLAEPKDVFDYNLGELPDAAQAQIKTLVSIEKAGLADFEAHPEQYPSYGPHKPGNAVPLDLGQGNLLVTKDGRARYVDTGRGIARFAGVRNDAVMTYEIHTRLALLELLSGTTPDQLRQDEFYKRLWGKLPRYQKEDPVSTASAEELKTLLENYWRSNPYRFATMRD